jgi:hypothetical protein
MKIVNTFLLLIVLTKSAYLLLASLASKTCVLYSESKAYKREPKLTLALFILTSNEHILDKIMVIIVELTIHLIRMSVQ